MINYDWCKEKDYPNTKNGLKVFDTFICGGGSTMGFKLAGYEHLGGVEIDEKVAECYKLNHSPKYLFIEDFRKFVEKKEFPEELYNLDVFSGSPPCSSFSIAGNREKDWGKSKVFAEGQKEQRLDDLFLEWVKMVQILKPKVAIAENVKGLILGNAKAFLNKIIQEINKINYDVQIFCLNAATMGVPQKRERVFLVLRRKELNLPKLKLEFNEKPILYHEILSNKSKQGISNSLLKLLPFVKKGDVNFSKACKRYNGKESFFNSSLVYRNSVVPTLTTKGSLVDFETMKKMNEEELRRASTFPVDYKFINRNPIWYMGMSIPPLMMYRIAKEIAIQLFNIKYDE